LFSCTDSKIEALDKEFHRFTQATQKSIIFTL
jgi:hypothetical protein